MLENIDLAIAEAEVNREVEQLPQDSDRAQWIGLLGRLFCAPITSVRKLGRVRGIYEFVLKDGSTIELGTAGQIRRQSAVIDAVFDATAKIPPTLKPTAWSKVAEAIVRSAVIEDLGSSSEDEMAGWLSVVARHVSVSELDMRNPIAAAKLLKEDLKPMYRSPDGTLLVHAPSLIAGIFLHCSQRITLQDAARRLRRLGFHAVQVGVRIGNATPHQRFWRAPIGFEM